MSLFFISDRFYQLIDLCLIRNCSEWTVRHTLTARYTFIMINQRSSVLITADCIHTTCLCTRSVVLYNCIVWTSFFTFSAFDTFFFINVSLCFAHCNCSNRTNLNTWMRHTLSTSGSHFQSFCRTSITSKRNNIYKRCFIHAFCFVNCFNTF